MSMFFNGYQPLLRVVIISVLAYAALVLILRVSGKRTLTKLNAFDLVITVALGSTLATIILNKEVALAEGFVAMGMLVAIQYAVAWGTSRSSAFGRIIKAEPTLLFFDGSYLRSAMRRQRVVEGEILSAVRSQGIASIDDVHAVVLETSGSLSVIRRPSDPDGPADRESLQDVQGRPDA